MPVMNALHEMLHRLNEQFSRVTDWLLIVIGAALIVKAAFAVDLPVARYVIMVLGTLLAGFGLYYRYRRKKRHR